METKHKKCTICGKIYLGTEKENICHTCYLKKLFGGSNAIKVL